MAKLLFTDEYVGKRRNEININLKGVVMKFKDITPEEFLCNDCAPCCPAVLETDESYVIIGDKLSLEAMEAIQGRVGENELAIEVKKGMIDNLKSSIG